MRAWLGNRRYASWVPLGIVFAPMIVQMSTMLRHRAGQGSNDTCPGCVRIGHRPCRQTTIYRRRRKRFRAPPKKTMQMQKYSHSMLKATV